MTAAPESPRKILIVEDEPATSIAVSGTLKRFGYAVLGPVDSGEAAVELAKTDPPDLVLMDIHLSGEMTGIEAATEIRRHLDTPVIFLTAHGDDETLELAKRAAPSGFLTKPFQAHDLKSVIEIGLYKNSLDREVRAMEEWRAGVMKSLGDAVFVTDEDLAITFLNPAAERLTGWNIDAAAGRKISEIVRIPKHGEEALRSLLSGRHSHDKKREGRSEILTKQGANRIVEYRHDVLRTGVRDVSGRVFVLRDVTKRELTDSLTGLPSHTLFMNRLEHALRRAFRRRQFAFAVIHIDIDRFRMLNESLGPSWGNGALIEVANRLRSMLEATEVGEFYDSTLAHLDADRFAILISGLDKPQNAIRIADRIHSVLGPPITAENERVFVAASIGIAFADARYLQPRDLLRDAETATKRAKSLGGARSEFFEPEMHASAVRTWKLERNLRAALADNALHLVYQPIIDLKTQEIVYFEALARWKRQDGSWVPPSEFIPVAEATGLIKAIGEWTLEEATNQVADWARRGDGFHPGVSVNVSALQIEPALVDRVRSIIDSGRLNPSDLLLEVTESSLIQRGDEAISVFTALKELGIKLALDDFGTGYSSLSYVHRYPFDTIKIDRSFITAMTEGKRSRIIDTILMLADSLQLTAVAEGIETAEQYTVLNELNCALGQGYLFARPMSPEDAYQVIINPESIKVLNLHG